MWRYAYCIHVFPFDGNGENLVVAEKFAADITHIYAVDAKGSQGTGIIGLKGNMKFYPRVPGNGFTPVFFQIMQAFLFATAPDCQMKIDRLPNGLFRSKRPRAQSLKFAKISAFRLIRWKKGPRFRDMFLADIHHAGAKRGTKPFMQACAKVITIQIGNLLCEMVQPIGFINHTY